MSSRIKDIAEFLNLSPATVSMVLNNRPGFSDETRAKVMDAARHFNYQPASSKRTFADTNETIPFIVYKRHGLVVAETPFFASLIEALESKTRLQGYNLSVHYLYAAEENFADNLSKIARRSENGILLLATEMDRMDCRAVQELGIPFVLIDNAMNGVNADKVLMNNRQGAYDAVAELHSLGHRKIGYMHSSVWISNFEERESGYTLAMRERGLEVREDWIARLGCSHETAYQDMLAYCETTRDMPTAFLADNDILAMGAIKALQEKNYRVPEDVSIIGFDDMPYCTMILPNLSTMRVDTQNIGSAAVRLLLEHNDFHQKIEIETELIRRDSVRKV